jgi:(2S)-methylsuccinyl-CoA dehydrogenase
MESTLVRGSDVLDRALLALSAARKFALAARAAADRSLEDDQRALHGYAWIETSVQALAASLAWAEAASSSPSQTTEILVLQIGFGEYLAQLVGGVPMSQNEFLRPVDLGIIPAAEELRRDCSVDWFLSHGSTSATRQQLVAALRGGSPASETLHDEGIDQIRHQFRRFSEERILPHAHGWHLADALIPDTLIDEMSALGTFGVCIDPEYGGSGLGKLAMCVITEELSRAWVGAGSLGTRSEIAGELIALGGTSEQKRCWLPRIADGSILPAAVFTEPAHGSDLGGLGTRAISRGARGWEISGAKTWITHAARSDLMTLLARTDPDTVGYRGLSMFLAPKPRGLDDTPFPAAGMSGSEIAVLGYRGMREYELSFDRFEVPAGALLGDVPGEGFKQLMRTFESARIQTAARAVGVARRAFDLSFDYALERKQFGRPLVEFGRVADKLALMYVETVLARELAYFAAREKDKGLRCDIEAGMAKLLAARVAWTNADQGVQIHGGNGYALEYEISRILCDARILNIFEGAAEIQAQIVARGKLGR